MRAHHFLRRTRSPTVVEKPDRQFARRLLILIDLRPLRLSRDFRALLAGLFVRQFGFQLTAAAVIFQVYALTRSPVAVGILSVAQLVASLAVTFVAVAVIDAVDRRVLLRTVGVLTPCCSAALAFASTFAAPSVAVIIVLASLSAALNALDAPARMAAMMSVIPEHARVPATVLRQFVQQISRLAAPLLAGVLIALQGGRVVAVYSLDTGCAVVSLVAVLRLSSSVGGRAGSGGIRALRECLRFASRSETIRACFVVDLAATVFGTPTALLPIVAVSRFHGGGLVYGLLSSATGAGGAVGALFSGWTRRVRRIGLLVVGAICTWGLCIAVFGLASSLVLALAALVAAGWADVLSAALRNAMIQTETPDALRGRISSLQAAVVQTGPRLGSTEGAFVASVMSPEFAIVTGGLAAVAGTVALAAWLPTLARYVRESGARSLAPPDTRGAGVVSR